MRERNKAREPLLGSGVRWLVRGIDFASRRLRRIVEFDDAEDGLFRIGLRYARHEIRLADGTRIHPGHPVLELHLWNEHLLRLPPKGPDLRWAAVGRRQTAESLRRLAAHMLTNPELDRVKALHMTPALAGGRLASSLSLIVTKNGFEPVSGVESLPARSRLSWLLDNLWLWVLTWTFSPLSLENWRFDRERREFWISRERFMALYGSEQGGTVGIVNRAPRR